MLILLIALLVSFVPSILLYVWLRNRKDDLAYRKRCGRLFWSGVLCVLPILLLSAVLYLALRLTGLHTVSPILYAALYAFIVLALSEELVKFLMARRIIKRSGPELSWLDVICFVTIVGIGFGLAEDIPYAFGSNAGQILLRGAVPGHAVYGMLTGWFLGKGMREGRRGYAFLALLPTTLMHGLYDFSLSEEFQALGDSAAFLPVLVFAGEIALGIRMLLLIRKAGKDERYTAPLVPGDELAEQHEGGTLP